MPISQKLEGICLKQGEDRLPNKILFKFENNPNFVNFWNEEQDFQYFPGENHEILGVDCAGSLEGINFESLRIEKFESLEASLY